jgi:hypothetical protein
MVHDSTQPDLASVAAAFDSGSTATPEIIQWQENNTNQRYPLGLSGSASLTEALHYITMLGKNSTGPTTIVTAYSGSGEEVRIPQ